MLWQIEDPAIDLNPFLPEIYNHAQLLPHLKELVDKSHGIEMSFWAKRRISKYQADSSSLRSSDWHWLPTWNGDFVTLLVMLVFMIELRASKYSPGKAIYSLETKQIQAEAGVPCCSWYQSKVDRSVCFFLKSSIPCWIRLLNAWGATRPQKPVPSAFGLQIRKHQGDRFLVIGHPR